MTSDRYSEQPIEPEILKILEKFAVPYVDQKLRLKKEAGQLRYFNERTGTGYEDF
jgi:hypothetical protein